MTSNARHLKWKIACLALILICQTTQQAEGHPRANTQTTKKLPMKRDLVRHHNVTASGTSVSPKPEQVTSRENNEKSIMDTLDGKFVFPSDDDTTSNNVGKVPTCRGSTFCENIVPYPRSLVDSAIERNSSLNLLTTVDVADIAQRIDSPDETPLCNSYEKVVFPQSAANLHNEWLYIVNSEKFQQGIRVEICRSENQKCNVVDGFADSFQTFCKQKHITRELVAMSSNGRVLKDTFRFPSSCCCSVRRIGRPMGR